MSENGKECLMNVLDISPRKEIERKLNESEEKYRLLFTSIDRGMAVFEIKYDSAGAPSGYRMIDSNETYKKLMNVSAGTAAGVMKECVPTEGNESWEKYFVDSVSKGLPAVFEKFIPSLNKFINTHAYEPKQGRVAVIIYDTTEIKEKEREKETLLRKLETQNGEMERFVYTVSHDLRNPLITISGFASLIKRCIIEKNYNMIDESAEHILAAGKNMAELLKDLLEISRVGRTEEPPEKVYFYDAAKTAAALTAGEIEKSGAQVEISDELKTASCAGAYVNFDRKRLVEVLQNLLVNAVKFTKKGVQPHILIGADTIRWGHTVYFVKDNGIGLEEKHLNSIFDLFSRLNPDVEGTGIGLAIVKRIVEMHGGKIWAESEGKNMGTTFYFTLSNV